MSYLRFTQSHEWLDTEHEVMTVGITQHAQGLLGDMVYVELPAVNTALKVGQEVGVLESVKAASDIYAPISGTITEINQEVIKNPALINQDPQGKGWLFKIKPHQPEEAFEEISALLKENEYLHDIGEE